MVRGISDAEFEAGFRALSSSVSGSDALVRHLFDDLGAVDAQGRPEQGCSLWWFIAAMEPGATKISLQRKELVNALRRGSFGTDEVVRLSNQWLGDVASLMKNDRHAPAERREMVLRMIQAAAEALDGWKKDKSYLGNDYFMVRTAPGKEMVSDDFNAGGRTYATKDDVFVERNYPLEARPTGRPAGGRSTARPAARPSAAATPPPSALAGLAQSDAVRALLAADVAETLTGRKVPDGLIGELGAAAADEVAGLHGLPEAKRALFKKAVGGAAEEYAELSVADAKKLAATILAELGLTTGDVRAFRQGLAAGLASGVTQAVAAPAGSVPFPAARAELVAIADRIAAAGTLTFDDVQALRAFTHKLDLSTIRDGAPDYQTLLQSIFVFAVADKVAVTSTPEGQALEEVYWHALNTHDALKAKKSEAKGYVPFETARKTFLAWYDAPPAAGEVEALVKKMDPADLAREQGFVNSSIGIVAIKLHGVSDAGAAAFREPLWKLVDERIAGGS